MAAAIVAYRAADVFGNSVQTLQQLVQRLGLQIRMAIQRFIQIGDVRSMMFVMVNLHRLGVDVWLESVKRVRQRRHVECHGFLLR